MANFCAKCGSPLDAATGLCPRCDAPQAAPAAPKAAPAAPAAPKAAPQPPKAPKKRRVWPIVLVIIAAVLVIGLLVLGVGGFFLYTKVIAPNLNGGTAVNTPNSPTTVTRPATEIVAPEAPETEVEAPTMLEEAVEAVPEEPAIPEICCFCGAPEPEKVICPNCGWNKSLDPDMVPLEVTVGSKDQLAPCAFALSVAYTDQSSSVNQSGNHNNTASATVDGKLETSWQEGVDGYGLGESLIYNLNGRYYISGIRLNLGNWRSEDWYTRNGVPKAFEIVTDCGDAFMAEFPYGMQEQWITFNKPILANELMFFLADYYEGSQYDDTCIAEVTFYGWPE